MVWRWEMSDTGKTRAQLVDELAAMRQQVARLEASVEEHRQTQAALRQSETNYRLLVESTLDGIIVIDAETLKTVFGNGVAAKMYGFASVEDAVGVDAMDFIHPNDRRRLAGFIAGDVLGKGTGGVTGTRMVRKDGSDFWASASATRIEFGGRPAVLVSIRDVTERRRMEEALRESEELSRGMMETAATGMYLLLDGRLQYVNRTFEQMSGYSKEELIGKTSLDYVHPDDREEAREKAIQVLKGQRTLPYEFRFVTKDSQTVWLLDWVTSIQYKGSRAVLGALTDVSERKRAEEELRQYHDHLEQLVEERTAELTKTQETATRQAQEIIEISTPIIQLRRGILLAPLIGSLSSDRAQQFTERLLTAIAQTNSTVALVDITGVPTVDTQTAHYITRTISAVRLLGAQAILTGVGPALASTLVELGIDLSRVITRSSLAAGFEDAMNLLKARS
jgi:PAS domain S-box-containing protein